MLYPSPHNSKELLLVGVEAGKAKKRLVDAFKVSYPKFSIHNHTDNITAYFKHSRPLTQRAFTVIRECFHRERQNTRKKYLYVGKATCELILEGENVGNKIPDKAYYALVPAHLVLTGGDMKILLEENVHEEADKHIHRDTAARGVDDRYFMQMSNSEKVLTLDARDVIYSYRRHRPRCTEHPHPCFTYMNDSYLMEIKKSEFSIAHNSSPPPISRDELKKSMKYAWDGAPLGNIFPVRDPQLLDWMSQCGMRVQVGSSYGYMISRGTALDLQATGIDDHPLLFHAQFMVENRLVATYHSCSIHILVGTPQLGHSSITFLTTQLLGIRCQTNGIQLAPIMGRNIYIVENVKLGVTGQSYLTALAFRSTDSPLKILFTDWFILILKCSDPSIYIDPYVSSH